MLKNKYAVITGGSDGIGFAIAEMFAKNGANICLIARNEEKLLDAKNKLIAYGSNVSIINGDLSNMNEIKDISDKILKINPDIDILVNNAGVGRFIPFDQMDINLYDMHLNLNVRAPYFLSQYLLGSLIKNKGNIINISSYFSKRMLTGRSSTAYSLTKGAIDSFTKSLAFEVGQKRVRVNAIAPGSISTPLLKANMSLMNDIEKQKIQNLIPMIYPLGRIGSTEDIASMATFLASDNAKWITGAIMSVDGGLTTN